MQYVFGPVASRRLGKSLGIDPVPPKTCNWNCVYCQLGRSVPLVNKRREYFPRADIVAEVLRALNKAEPGSIDWITFVGSGEPTLHSGLGWMMREIKQFTSLPLAVITNGSLLYLPEVQQELLIADAVLPSLDAGNRELYRKINRPWPKLSFDQHVQGLVEFRKVYPGKFWLEVMLVKGVNDTPQALQEIAQIVNRINPDRVDITLPTRPPAETWVDPATPDAVSLAEELFGQAAHIVSELVPQAQILPDADLAEAIMHLIIRHPIPEDELTNYLAGWTSEQIQQALLKLQTENQAKLVERFGRHYWTSSEAVYAEN